MPHVMIKTIWNGQFGFNPLSIITCDKIVLHSNGQPKSNLYFLNYLLEIQLCLVPCDK
jgi:hypothetical protein